MWFQENTANRKCLSRRGEEIFGEKNYSNFSAVFIKNYFIGYPIAAISQSQVQKHQHES